MNWLGRLVAGLLRRDRVAVAEAAAGHETPAGFSKLLMRRLRDAGDTRELSYDAERFRLVYEGSQARYVNLGNFYQEHLALDAADRDEHLRRIIVSLVSSETPLPEDFADVRMDLRPKLWKRATFAAMELRRQLDDEESMDLPLYPVGDHLLVGLVYDLPHSMRSISREELRQWGVSYYEAQEAALQNLQETTEAFAGMDEGVYLSLTGDSYDACRLLLPDVLREFAVRGRPVAMVPNRGTLVLTGDADEAGLERMLEIAESSVDEVRSLSFLPLVLEDDDWTDWHVPADHPLAGRFLWLRNQFLAGLYHQQAEMLAEIHRRRGEDRFVAAYMGREDQDRAATSFCVWHRDIPSLLPETDELVLVEGEGEVLAEVPFERFRQVAGELLRQDEDLYPPRYAVDEFPTPGQLAAMADG